MLAHPYPFQLIRPEQSGDLRARPDDDAGVALNPVDQSEVASLAKKIEDDPKDHQSRIDLAVALNAVGKREEALDHLLQSVRMKRDWNEEAARKQLVKFFEAWGPKDEFTILGRRKLSSILFS